MPNKNTSLIIILAILAAAGIGLYYAFFKEKPVPQVSNFEECANAGYPIMESYPRQCRTPDGRTFVEDIGNELEKRDLIKVTSPRPNQVITSPLKIQGEARGTWFFEASFPIKLYDNKGNEIGLAIAQAKSDWMTENFVPFEAEISFSAKEGEKGLLVFKKDNPSGLPEKDDELHMPVIFGKEQATREIDLYYYNEIRDREIAEYIPCSPDAVLPVKRKIPFSNTPIQDAVKELLKGKVSQAETQAGYKPMFPLEGVELTGANLKDGILTLEFADPLNVTGGGSCRVRLLWAEISKTAKQFPGVTEVKFQPEFLFQP